MWLLAEEIDSKDDCSRQKVSSLYDPDLLMDGSVNDVWRLTDTINMSTIIQIIC